MTPSIYQIQLFSKDIDKTAEFYNVLGFDLKPVHGWTAYRYYLDVVENGGHKLFITVRPKEHEAINMDGLGFKVESVSETLKKLIALGVQVLRPGNPRIYDRCVIAEVRDPDGRKVFLSQ